MRWRSTSGLQVIKTGMRKTAIVEKATYRQVTNALLMSPSIKYTFQGFQPYAETALVPVFRRYTKSLNYITFRVNTAIKKRFHVFPGIVSGRRGGGDRVASRPGAPEGTGDEYIEDYQL